MDDETPLLTIEDVTREFRVSAKSVRRRLQAGAIEGAYKRPSDRGPMWVMPRASVEALALPRRAGSPQAAALPDDPSELAQYWQERATAAEAALADATRAGTLQPPDRHRGRAGLALRIIGLVVVLASVSLVTALVVDEDAPASSDLSAVERSARASVEDLTDPGDDVGYVGDGALRLVPTGRTAVPVGVADDLSRRDPRVVIVDQRAAVPQEVVGSLGGAAAVALTVDTGPTTIHVIERADRADDPGEERPGEERAANSPATTDPGSSAPSVPEASEDPDDAPTPPGNDPAARAPDEPDADEGTAADEGTDAGTPAAETGTITVEAGDSFWSIAATQLEEATGDPPTTEEITAYWAQVIDANADRLVEPDNPDLLHVGQQLELPPTTPGST